MMDHNDLRKIIQTLNRVAGFIQFSGKENAGVALKKCIDVIETLQVEVDLQIEAIVKEHENCKNNPTLITDEEHKKYEYNWGDKST